MWDFLCSIQFTFLLNKKYQNQNSRNAIHAFAPKDRMLKLEKQALKFNDIYMRWSLRKIDLETNFLNLENLSYIYIQDM